MRLWIASLALTVGWVALYLAVVNQRRWSSDLSMTWDLLCALDHPRHRAGSGRRAVALGPLGAGLPVGHARRRW